MCTRRRCYRHGIQGDYYSLLSPPCSCPENKYGGVSSSTPQSGQQTKQKKKNIFKTFSSSFVVGTESVTQNAKFNLPRLQLVQNQSVVTNLISKNTLQSSHNFRYASAYPMAYNQICTISRSVKIILLIWQADA